MTPSVPRSPVVHLELHTADLARARALGVELESEKAQVSAGSAPISLA